MPVVLTYVSNVTGGIKSVLFQDDAWAGGCTIALRRHLSYKLTLDNFLAILKIERFSFDDRRCMTFLRGQTQKCYTPSAGGAFFAHRRTIKNQRFLRFQGDHLWRSCGVLVCLRWRVFRPGHANYFKVVSMYVFHTFVTVLGLLLIRRSTTASGISQKLCVAKHALIQLSHMCWFVFDGGTSPPGNMEIISKWFPCTPLIHSSLHMAFFSESN